MTGERMEMRAENRIGNVALNVALIPLATALPMRKGLILLARPEGLEPPTYRFEVCRSIQLSYRRASW